MAPRLRIGWVARVRDHNGMCSSLASFNRIIKKPVVSKSGQIIRAVAPGDDATNLLLLHGHLSDPNFTNILEHYSMVWI
jgi:predicted DNA binding protein